MIKPWEIYGFPPPKSEASKGELSLVEYEIYSGIELPNMPVFVRLDGWNFHSLTKKLNFKKPYDKFFAECLASVAKEFFRAFNCTLAYVFSDEINLLFLKIPAWKRIEKLNSVFAGIASAKFYEFLSEKFSKIPIFSFDCRCIPLPKEKILPYLIWRQAECFRNYNNSWAQYVLKKKGYSASRATKELVGMKTQELRKLISENVYSATESVSAENSRRALMLQSISKEKFQLWQERGILLYKESYIKKGYNPLKKEYVEVERCRVKEDWGLEWFGSSEGRKIIARLIED